MNKPKTSPSAPHPDEAQPMPGPRFPDHPLKPLERGRRFLPTPEIQEQMCSFIRAGGVPNVAAEALGLSVQLFEVWMRRSRSRHALPEIREFGKAVRKAIAQARMAAETEAFRHDKLAWLKSGPGRESASQSGWSNPVSLKPKAAQDGIDITDWLVFCRKIADLLAPYPEAKAVVAEWFSQEFKLKAQEPKSPAD